MTAGPCLGCSADYFCHVGRDDSGALIPTPRCSACDKRATVSVHLRLYKQPLFEKPNWVWACPSCLDSIKAQGTVLEMTGFREGEGAT